MIIQYPPGIAAEAEALSPISRNPNSGQEQKRT